MAEYASIQTRIEERVNERSSAVLANMGLTVSDAVRILLTHIAKEGALPAGLVTDPEGYDAWFHEKVLEALSDARPAIQGSDVKAHFAGRRAAARRKDSKKV